MIRLLILISIAFVSFSDPPSIGYRKLSWSDFKGKPDSRYVALSMVTISFETNIVDDKFVFEVYSQFIPTRSFTTTTKERILKHEQLHFDITELMVRRLQGLLKNVSTCKEANNLYEQTIKEWQQIQVQYDQETNNSINQEQQAKWEAQVQIQLK